jgi:hypothetical protein
MTVEGERGTLVALDEAHELPVEPKTEDGFWTDDRRRALRARVALAGEREVHARAADDEGRARWATMVEAAPGWSADRLRWASDLYAGVGRRIAGRHDCAWCAGEVAGIAHLLSPALCRGKVARRPAAGAAEAAEAVKTS